MNEGRLSSIYVYDGLTRLIHWAIALSTFFLIVSGLYAERLEPGSEQSAIWILHINCGRILTVSLVARIIWGLVGSKWARLGEFWHWSTWARFAKTRRYSFEDTKFGHDPFASLSYIIFYFVILIVILTGWVLAGMMHAIGPLANELFDDLEYQNQILDIHEWGFWIVAGFVVIHIAALVYHETRHGIPISQAMLSGYQFRRAKENKK